MWPWNSCISILAWCLNGNVFDEFNRISELLYSILIYFMTTTCKYNLWRTYILFPLLYFYSSWGFSQIQILHGLTILLQAINSTRLLSSDALIASVLYILKIPLQNTFPQSVYSTWSKNENFVIKILNWNVAVWSRCITSSWLLLNKVNSDHHNKYVRGENTGWFKLFLLWKTGFEDMS